MDKYRFAALPDGKIIEFDTDFQKKIFYKYLEVNNLDEDTVLEANQDWDALLEGLSEADRQKEMLRPLPVKYTGDVFEELDKLFIDFVSMGVTCDIGIIFENIIGMDSWFFGDREVRFETARILKELGYIVEEIEVEGESWTVVR